jgi:putative intracellular protease/amidase
MTDAVHLFVFEGMADGAAALAVASIRNPRSQRYPGRYSVRTAARSLTPVRTMGGINIVPDVTIDDVSPTGSSMLILPGGDAWAEGGNLEALERAYAFIGAGVPIAAICGATLALARMGLLDDRLHTSNDAEYIAQSGYSGRRYYRNVGAICDRDVITASGAAPVEFAYEISKRLYLYSPSTLEAWYALHKHGNAAQFYEPAAQSA